MEENTKKRRHRSTDERLAEMERRQAEIKAKMEAQLRALEEQKKRLASTTATKKSSQERQKRFDRAVKAIAHDWDERHLIAAIARAVDMDAEMLLAEGEVLLEQHGQPRRGRRPRQG
ncbi:hypothetical protein [Acidithiobacillus sulfuriphilus]|uniref:hypothetical protein n=1 Tax=Acidithiobacillus sulfuriphilus TaxID=1867749 RepID=UPI003F61483C